MKALVYPALALLLLGLLPAPAAPARDATAPTLPTRDIAVYHPDQMVHGGAPGVLAKALADSFNIYGGRRLDGSNDRRPEGQFESLYLEPQLQGWIGVDRTEALPRWHVSTFNAANLDPQVDNRAMWCGVEPGTAGYTTPPGYGNNWNDILDWSQAVNPTVNSQVRLQFDFNHDTEPGYDYFLVEYDSAGTFLPWASFDGSNKDVNGDFLTEVQFDETLLFTPLMYSNFKVHVRLRVVSDGAWSDEDGLWPTKGAAQVDNIRVSINGTPVVQGNDGLATFEDLGGVDDVEGWEPVAASFAGDFSKLLPEMRDIDPCRFNITPQMGFLDDGTPPNNEPDLSTGGTTSGTWTYGVRGGWVVNYNGGLTFGETGIYNEIWSPEIEWDDPTTTADDALVGGAFIRFSVYQHLPLENGIFWIWSVRSFDGAEWSAWRDRNFVYYDDTASYNNTQFDVTDLLEPGRTHVQMALGVADLADVFILPGNDATPAPTFDNVSFWRYDLAGPAFSTRNIDLFNDGFPNVGHLDYAGRPQELSVRVDMARDVSTGIGNVAGDSIVVDVVPTIAGTQLSGMPLMKWVLEANPLFDGVRTLPAGVSALGPNAKGWNRWFGTVAGDSARTSAGAAVADRFFFDMPNDGPAVASYQADEPAMFYPGDRIRYFIEASDTGGNTTSLPADTTGFASGGGYNRLFTIRALPGLVDDGGPVVQPDILLINDFGHRGGENDFLHAFGQNGMFEDTDYEVYTVRGPSSMVSNGIGSSGVHGATADQLVGYTTLLYMSGDLASGVMSDGTNQGGNDKGNDVELLNQWFDLVGTRQLVCWGDNISSWLVNSGSAGATFLTTRLAVDLQDADVSDEVGGTVAPIVEPSAEMPGLFATPYLAYGGCLSINTFDSIRPNIGPNTHRAYSFTNGEGTTYSAAAAVWNAWTDNLGGTDYPRVALTFAHGFPYIQDIVVSKAAGGLSVRSIVLREVLEALGHTTFPGAAVGNEPTPSRELVVMQNHPNPFNPSTTIRFTAPERGRVTVRVYNLRGELVRTLLDQEVDAGDHPLVWDGTDRHGRRVSSGVYLYRVAGFGQESTQKMALVK